MKENTKHILLKTTFLTGVLWTIVSLFGPNPFLCLPAYITLYIIIKNLFISRYTSAIGVAFLYQWLQTSIKILYATITLTDIKSLTDFPNHIIEAYILSSIALIVLTYGMSISLKKTRPSDKVIKNTLHSIKFKHVLILYFSIGIIAEIIGRISGLFQISVMISAFKWGIFYIIFIYCYNENKHKLLLYLLIVYEIIIGFFSYFADWKTIIFYSLISSLAVLNLNLKKIIKLLLYGCLVIYIALIWTGIKSEYRQFLSQGGKQVVLVSGPEAYKKLFRLVTEFQITDQVAKSFLDRMSYIDYFSSCLSYVPSTIPHENGELTLRTIKHIFMPRLLFPNKPIIDESTHLTKYTGIFYANYSMGVSFSLGYVGDFYIDYGIIGMFIALFILGLILGKIFTNLYTGTKIEILALSIIASSFMILFRFEISMVKLIGNIVVFWIFYRMIEIFIAPYVIHLFINKTDNE